MRKGYQMKVHNERSSKRNRLSTEEGKVHFNSQNGAMTYAYKGLVIDKRNGLYTVRDVKLKGFPVDMVKGLFTDTHTLRVAIENGLLESCPEKLECLRARNKNVICGGCRTPFLFRREMLTDWLEGKVLECPYCYLEEFDDRLEWVSDDKFY